MISLESGELSLVRVLEAMPLPMAVIAPDHTVLFLNRAAKKKGAQEGKCFEILAGIDRPCKEHGLDCPVMEAISRGRPVESIRDLDLGEGIRSFEVLACPIIGDSGRPEAVVEIIRDVTDSMLLRQFRQAREQMRALEQAIPDAIITIDAENRVVAVNQAVRDVFGVSPDELRREGIEIIMPEAIREEHRKYVARAAARGSLKQPGRISVTEVTALHRERGEFPMELSLSVWSRGEEPMFTAVIRDISARKALEEERLLQQHQALEEEFGRLEKIKQEWQLILDSVPDPVLMTDSDDKIIRCNRALAELVSLSYPEILGRSWKDLLAEHGIEGGDPWGDNPTMVHADSGRTFAVQVSGLLNNDRSAGSVVVLRDVTAETAMTRAMEENRLALQEALDGISETIVRVARESDFSLRVKTGSGAIAGRLWSATGRIAPLTVNPTAGAGKRWGPYATARSRENLPRKSAIAVNAVFTSGSRKTRSTPSVSSSIT